MRYSSIGESLWSVWDGENFEQTDPEAVVYYTVGKVDLDNDLIRRALAAAIQHDGTADTLGDAYKAIEAGRIVYGYSGYEEGEDTPTQCDWEGDSFYGEAVKNPQDTTWVEVRIG